MKRLLVSCRHYLTYNIVFDAGKPMQSTPKLTPILSTIAWMPPKGLFEDFFDTINVSFETYRKQQSGGWIFNFIEALEAAGVHSVIIHISARVNEPLRFKHEPTGATVCILPSPLLHRALRALGGWVQQWNIRYITKPFMALDSYLVLPLFALRKELRIYHVKAIIFQEYENPIFDVCVLLGRLMKLPVYANFQGAQGPQTRLEYLTRFLAIRACAGLIIGSQKEILRVCECYKVSSQKIAQIYNTFDVTKWNPLDRTLARDKLRISRNSCVVLSHGRIDIKHKGLDILLSAWVQVCKERPNKEMHLLLVGSGMDSHKLSESIAVLQLSNVLWVDEYIQDFSLLWLYISASDLYVLSSRAEGFPVAPIEAMAGELPIVATDVSGIREILGEGDKLGGIIVPPEDPQSLAMALGHLVDHPTQCRIMGRRARRRVEQTFSYELIGEQLRDFVLRRY